jgi:hypothetical protein
MARRVCLILLIAMVVAGCSGAAPTATPAAEAPRATTEVAPAAGEPVAPTDLATPSPLPAQTHAVALPAVQSSVSVLPTPGAPARGSVLPTLSVHDSALATPAAKGKNPLATRQVPASGDDPKAKYVLKEERVLGAYTLRLWHNSASDFTFDNITTLSIVGQPQIEITSTAGFGKLTGKDITGTGYPVAIIETYTGGAHCCAGTVAYELGPEPRLLLDAPRNNCGGRFEDLNGDNVYEFVTCDDQFAYAYCPFAMSPIVQVVYRYKDGNYSPASPKYPGQYAGDIKRDLARAQSGKPGEQAEWDGTNKCSVLPLVLDYLYTGEDGKAWSALDEYYRGSDAKKFRAEIEQGVYKGPLYVSP